MKIWQLLDDSGEVCVAIPTDQLLDAEKESVGRDGYGIYEALSPSGEILYTGRTRNLANRLRAHSTQSPWWGFAAKIQWTPCADYAEAVALERSAISSDRGPWNVSGAIELKDYQLQALPAATVRRLTALYGATDEGPWEWQDYRNFVATLRSAGWTLQSIASPLMITREAVRLHEARGVVDLDLVIPHAPRRPVPAKKVWPTIPPRIREEMRALQQQASRVKGWTALEHPDRTASVRLSEMIAEAKLRGVREREIAEAMGVATVTVRQRLARHGYMKNAPSQASYSGTLARSEKQSHCNRGHELSGDNLRLVNGDSSKRVCKACDRLRVERYRLKKRAAQQRARSKASA